MRCVLPEPGNQAPLDSQRFVGAQCRHGIMKTPGLGICFVTVVNRRLHSQSKCPSREYFYGCSSYTRCMDNQMNKIISWLMDPPTDGPQSTLLLRLMAGGVFFWE